MLNPAKTVIEVCGGVDAVMEMTGRARSIVLRWTYPRERGGTDGLIPAQVQQLLMERAVEIGLPLKPDHFFAPVAAESECPPNTDTAA